MDYGLTEEQLMIKDLCRQIAEEKMKPVLKLATLNFCLRTEQPSSIRGLLLI